MRAVTIISDFGIKDHYVALLKGAILKHHSDIHLIDVSHQVDTYDIRQASYFIKSIYNSFPEGTINIVAVNNFYRHNYEILCFEYKDRFFIGPNNGIFSLAFDSINEEAIYRIVIDDADQNLFELIGHGVSLICKGMSITEVGPPLNQFDKKLEVQPVITDNEIRATITHIDKFDNIVLNVHREYFEFIRKDRRFEIYFKYFDPATSINKSYSAVPVGEVVCLFNSSNYLEIAINMGKAASLLDLRRDETIQIKFLD